MLYDEKKKEGTHIEFSFYNVRMRSYRPLKFIFKNVTINTQKTPQKFENIKTDILFYHKNAYVL